ncbi:MAG: DUF1648 domain-containing protein [Candidatus Pacebacteria bacterium]|nr:DUF1648 domain-containing protein [Candidatus Paceibacterota bacterium]
MKYFPIFLIVISFAVGIYFYPQLPDQITSHWDSLGQPNGYMGKFWGVFLMPFISIFLYALLIIIPKIDPKAENIKKFRKNFNVFIAALFVFLFYIFALTIFWNLGHEFNMTYAIVPAMAVLFYMIGLLLEKAEPNWSIGIRTPWTLSNENIWKQTHALGAKLFKLTALISIAGLLFYQYAFWILIGSIISVTIFLYVYSYFLHKKLSSN